MRFRYVIDEYAAVVLVSEGITVGQTCVKNVVVPMAQVSEFAGIEKPKSVLILRLFNYCAAHAQVQPNTRSLGQKMSKHNGELDPRSSVYR